MLSPSTPVRPILGIDNNEIREKAVSIDITFFPARQGGTDYNDAGCWFPTAARRTAFYLSPPPFSFAVRQSLAAGQPCSLSVTGSR